MLSAALDSAPTRLSDLQVVTVADDAHDKWRCLDTVAPDITTTDVGSQRINIIQSLLVTCRLHAVDSYSYLVDVLQRISEHPANCPIELTPWMWKSLFADAPLRSAITLSAILQPWPILPAYGYTTAIGRLVHSVRIVPAIVGGVHIQLFGGRSIAVCFGEHASAVGSQHDVAFSGGVCAVR